MSTIETAPQTVSQSARSINGHAIFMYCSPVDGCLQGGRNSKDDIHTYVVWLAIRCNVGRAFKDVSDLILRLPRTMHLTRVGQTPTIAVAQPTLQDTPMALDAIRVITFTYCNSMA